MWTSLCGTRVAGLSLAACALGAACSKRAARVDASVQQSVIPATADCAAGSVRPSPVPPAQGMWMSAGSAQATPVAAMIGPAEVRTGSTVVTRTIETVERSDSIRSLRARIDDAVVRLELVPRYLGAPAESQRRPTRRDEMEPAAVYALTPLVSLASYEVCAGPPAVRYLRRDADGRVEKDAMLYWASTTK